MRCPPRVWQSTWSASIQDDIAWIVGRLAQRNIGMTAVTKAVLGCAPVVRALLAGVVAGSATRG